MPSKRKQEAPEGPREEPPEGPREQAKEGQEDTDPQGGVAAAREKKWQTIKKRAGYCGLCCDVLRDFAGHASRRPRCKSHQDSRRLTTDELAKMRAEFDEEEQDPHSAKEKKVAVAKARQAERWKPPQAPSENVEYKMNFGKYSGSKAYEMVDLLEPPDLPNQLSAQHIQEKRTSTTSNIPGTTGEHWVGRSGVLGRLPLHKARRSQLWRCSNGILATSRR